MLINHKRHCWTSIMFTTSLKGIFIDYVDTILSFFDKKHWTSPKYCNSKKCSVNFAKEDRNFKTEITLCYGTIVQNQKNECRFSRLTSFAFLLCRSNKCAVQSKGNQLNFEHETFMLMVDWCHLSCEASSLVVKN